MAFTNDPNIPRDRVRLIIGDTDPDEPLLEDVWYDVYLSENDDNLVRAGVAAAQNILAQLSHSVNHKVDNISIQDRQRFQNYMEWLKSFITDPSISGYGVPVPYAGGISKDDFISNRENDDNIPLNVQRGFSTSFRQSELEEDSIWRLREDFTNDNY